MLVRLTKDQYYKIANNNPDNKIQIEYMRLRFERFIAVRHCGKCNGVGHSQRFCKVNENLKQVLEEFKKKRVCGSCALKEYDKAILQVNDPMNAVQKALTNVTHGVFSTSCMEYTKQLKILKKRYDF